ncbi:hypothetical protein HORIV_16910 [Vreelandella olivaria]|uniref:Dihydrodipicolinate synthase n=1 Tax=Vreelandella olivaria TaxID=390919 RepID=A0ABM7GFH3_9GAMM|nr:hypothetical protein HORIV_16910 [Halomonas olivaria]
MSLDLRGLTPAPVTPFTRDGEVDFAAIKKLGSWLGGIDGVKGLVVLGHAGEGTFMTSDEQRRVIEAFVEAVKVRSQLLRASLAKATMLQPKKQNGLSRRAHLLV